MRQTRTKSIGNAKTFTNMTQALFTDGADLHTDWVFERIAKRFPRMKEYNNGTSAIFYVEDIQEFYIINIRMFTNVITIENFTEEPIDPDIADELFKILTTDIAEDLFVADASSNDGVYKMLFYYRN